MVSCAEVCEEIMDQVALTAPHLLFINISGHG